jgi:Fe-S cluster assembly ATP-binding protein
VLAITHYSRLLSELRADRVHVLAKGQIVRSGGPELAQELEESGYVGLVGAELAGEDDSLPAASETSVSIGPDPFA